MNVRKLALAFVLATCSTAISAEPRIVDTVRGAKRIVFLGDSITASGQYVAMFDAWMIAQHWDKTPQVIDCGLPSETVSGLSEEGHAGGQFPRPDLFERLDRVLALTKPDLVFACYGINCGIYEPFDEARFASYQAGYKRLKEKVEAIGCKLIVVTPPFYDDLRSPRKFSYNEVLDRYSAWLVEQRKSGWQVIDLHTAMTNKVRDARKADAKFTVQPDGVHPSREGHWLMAAELIRACGDDRAASASSPEEMLKQIKCPVAVLSLSEQRVNVLRDSYVATAGHKRPGVAKGLAVDEAEREAKEITLKIEQLLQEMSK